MQMIELGRFETDPDSMRVVHLETIRGKISIELDINRPSQRYAMDVIASGGLYEGEAVQAMFDHLREGETFFDVGACFGWFSAIAGQIVGEKGCVVAFEPDEANFAWLRINAPSAVCYRDAVSDHGGETRLYQNLDNDGGSALWECGKHPHNSATRDEGNPSIVIPCIKLDEFAYLSPSAIKIDTEGAELEVLRGAQTILRHGGVSLVICERNLFGLAQMGHQRQDVENLMSGYGFKNIAAKNDDKTVGNWIFVRK